MTRLGVLALPVLLVAAPPALAHGLLMQARSEGAAIVGTVYFSNGQRAGGVWVELFDMAPPGAAAATVQTGTDGSFRLPGPPARRYEVRATGDEGHTASVTIAATGDGTRGIMIDDAAEPAQGLADLPAWAVFGGLLALSTLPALWLRRRKSG